MYKKHFFLGNTKSKIEEYVCDIEDLEALEYIQDKAIIHQVTSKQGEIIGQEYSPTFSNLYKYEPRIKILGDVPVWRYSNYQKLEYLISSRRLYLCRIDRFDDNLEGISPDSCREAAIIDERYNQAMKDESMRMMDIRFANNRKSTFTSCWTLHEEPEDYMWTNFANDKTSMAIESTFVRLKLATKKSEFPLHFEPIRYFEEPHFNQESYWFPTLFKRKCVTVGGEVIEYYKEKELRLSVYYVNTQDYRELEVRVDLKRLIKQIHLHKSAGIEDEERVLNLLRNANLDIPVVKHQ